LIPAGSGIPRYRNYEAVMSEDTLVSEASLSF
jgi:hypothetical protein